MKTGISLSGGGAKGIAHIGVLQALMDHDIQIDMMAPVPARSLVPCLQPEFQRRICSPRFATLIF